MKHKLYIAIIEDDQETLSLYQKYINSYEEIECISATTSAENFLKYAASIKKLDLVFLDIHLPGMTGLQAITKIKSKFPEVEIIMLTSFSDEETIFKALRAGATGYLLKEGYTQREFYQTIITIKEDGAPVSPTVAKKIFNYFAPPKSIFSALSKKKDLLTKKEKMVLNHLVKGLTYKEIGAQMDISINSVRFYIKQIYKKLQVNSRKKLINKYKDSFLKGYDDL